MKAAEHTYAKQAHPIFVAVDVIIFGLGENALEALLINRDFAPKKGGLSLIGGFLQKDESLDEAAKRILLKLTGLSEIYMEQLYSFGEVKRDDGGRTISVAYFALVRKHGIKEEHILHNGASWHNILRLPELIFDHKHMLNKALQTLQNNCRTHPIGFELLDKKFTFPQFQQLYELIYNKRIDKRNFRKKVEQMGLINKLEEKDKQNSRKGAFLYTFNQEKYEQFQEMKYHLDF